MDQISYNIKYSTGKPPVYQACRKAFGINWDTMNIVFTYGDTIYSKNLPIPDDLVAHETTHVHQQMAMGKEKWWELYLTNKNFRLCQEVEAYKNQMEFINKTYNRQKRKELKKFIIKSMTTIYGDMCTEKEAEKLIS